jgi:hypothetical protein
MSSGASDERFLAAARAGTEDELRRALVQCEFRLVTGSGPFFFRRGLSPFGAGSDRFKRAARSIVDAIERTHGLHRVRAASARRHVACREARLFRSARRALFDLLDCDALRHLRRAGAAVDGGTYAFLVGNPRARRWREQAIEAYPGLVSHLLDDRLERVIDAGKPLTRWLAERLQAPPEAVRHFKRAPARALVSPLPRLQPDQSTVLAAAAAVLSLTPGPRRPKCRAEWRELLEATLEVAPLYGCFAFLRRPALEAFRHGSLRRFLRLPTERRDEVLRGTGVRSPRPCSGLREVVDTFRAILELADDRGVPCERIDLALAGLSIAEWVRVDQAWHDAVAEFDRVGPGAELDENGSLKWPALAAELKFGDLWIVPLVTSGALRAEGRAMKHCVATYAGHCLLDRTHVFSIRDARGQRRATLQVDLVPEPDSRLRPKLVQSRGPANAAPDAECVKAGRHLMELLGRLPQSHFAALDDALRQRQARCIDLQDAWERPRRAYALTQALPEHILALLGEVRAEPARTIGASPSPA